MRLKTILFSIIIMMTNIVYAANFESDTFQTKNGKQLTITFIKHGSLMITLDTTVIQIDPVSEYADYSTFSKADIILITHEHGDHLDLKAIHDCMKNGTKIFSNGNSKAKIGKGEAMKNGDKVSPINYFTIEAVPAYNNSPGHEKYHPKGRDNGYVLTYDGLRVYIAGDTEDIPELKSLKDIDIAFLPVNQPYTMTVSQAVKAANMFSPKILYPYHYGNTDIQKLEEELKGSAIDVRIRQLQ